MADVKPKASKRSPKAAEPAPSGAGAGKAEKTPDEKPERRRGPASKAEKKRGELRAIEVAFRELLVDMPGMFGAMSGDEWLVDHTSTQGPPATARIVAECDRSDAFRATCLKMTQGQSVVMLAFALSNYFAPIGMHYGVIPGGAKVGVPVRRLSPRRREAPEEAPPFVGGHPAPPPPQATQNGDADLDLGEFPPAEAI